MNTQRAYVALTEVARREGKSVESVISSIESAIDAAIRNAEEKNDVTVLNRWRMISANGRRPTAAELVAYLGREIERME